MDIEIYKFLENRLKINYIINHINLFSITPINQDLKRDIITFVYTWDTYKLNFKYDWRDNPTSFRVLETIVNIYKVQLGHKLWYNNCGNDTDTDIHYFKQMEEICKQKKNNLIYSNRLKFFKNWFGISIGKPISKEIHTFHIERLLMKNWYIPKFCRETLTEADTILINIGGIDINNLIMKFLIRFKIKERRLFLEDCHRKLSPRRFAR